MQLVANTLVLASTYVLLAVGYVVVYRASRVLNLAHGELLMIGAYATYAMQTLFRSQFPAQEDWYLLAAVPVALLIAVGLGLAVGETREEGPIFSAK